jgi:hypothetical protein
MKKRKSDSIYLSIYIYHQKKNFTPHVRSIPLQSFSDGKKRVRINSRTQENTDAGKGGCHCRRRTATAVTWMPGHRLLPSHWIRWRGPPRRWAATPSPPRSGGGEGRRQWRGRRASAATTKTTAGWQRLASATSMARCPNPPLPDPARAGREAAAATACNGGVRRRRRRHFFKFTCSLMLICCGFESNAFVLQVYNVCDCILFSG